MMRWLRRWLTKRILGDIAASYDRALADVDAGRVRRVANVDDLIQELNAPEITGNAPTPKTPNP